MSWCLFFDPWVYCWNILSIPIIFKRYILMPISWCFILVGVGCTFEISRCQPSNMTFSFHLLYRSGLCCSFILWGVIFCFLSVYVFSSHPPDWCTCTEDLLNFLSFRVGVEPPCKRALLFFFGHWLGIQLCECSLAWWLVCRGETCLALKRLPVVDSRTLYRCPGLEKVEFLVPLMLQ